MRKYVLGSVLSFALPLVSVSMHAQVAAAAAAGAAAAAPHLIAAAPAILTGAVSSGSAHVGQAVLAKLASGSALSNGAKLPAGSQLLGKITQAVPAAGNKSKSQLGMMFDKFRLPDGSEHALSPSMLQAVGSGRASRRKRDDNEAQANANAQASTNTSSGGLLGGVTNVVGGTVNTLGNTVNGLVGTVTSLPGVVLDSTGTLMAQGQNVEVPAGTQVSIAASASASAE